MVNNYMYSCELLLVLSAKYTIYSGFRLLDPTVCKKEKIYTLHLTYYKCVITVFCGFENP